MSSGSSQANAFYEEVSINKVMWFAEDADGTALEFDVDDNRVSFPLWSSESRITRLKKLNPDLLSQYIPREISWRFFKEVLAPMLRDKNRLIGVNLSGKNISGFDLSIESLINQIEAFELYSP